MKTAGKQPAVIIILNCLFQQRPSARKASPLLRPRALGRRHGGAVGRSRGRQRSEIRATMAAAVDLALAELAIA
jgi:hypothetical protein